MLFTIGRVFILIAVDNPGLIPISPSLYTLIIDIGGLVFSIISRDQKSIYKKFSKKL